MDEVSDEMLMAYVDGELCAADRAIVEAALAKRPELWNRIRAFAQTRAPIQDAFQHILDQPVPGRLIEAVRDQPEAAGSPHTLNPMDTPDWLLAEMPKRRHARSMPVGWAMAACVAMLVAGGALGRASADLFPAASGSGGPIASATPFPVAEGAVQKGLESVASGQTVAFSGHGQGVQAGGMTIQSTFRARDNRFCRQYEVRAGQGGAEIQHYDGLACRGGDGQWTVEYFARATGGTPTQSPGQGSGLVPAGGGSQDAGVDAAVGRVIDGGLFDPAEEQQLLKSGWRVS